jgi:hypothetical protein
MKVCSHTLSLFHPIHRSSTSVTMHITFSLTLTVFALSRSVLAQGYRGSCDAPEFSGDDILARCGNGHGGYNQASLNLNTCFANQQGQIVYRKNGNFLQSCDGIWTTPSSGTWIYTTCKDGSGNSHDAKVDTSKFDGERCCVMKHRWLTGDVDSYISNYGGNLAC